MLNRRSHGCKLPKTSSLATCVHHLTSSKHLIELLNRIGYCVSYNKMLASIIKGNLAKVEEFGTVMPTVIKPGLFLQSEETRQREYYARNYHGCLSQKTFTPDRPPNVVEQRPKPHSLQAKGTTLNSVLFEEDI